MIRSSSILTFSSLLLLPMTPANSETIPMEEDQVPVGLVSAEMADAQTKEKYHKVIVGEAGTQWYSPYDLSDVNGGSIIQQVSAAMEISRAIGYAMYADTRDSKNEIGRLISIAPIETRVVLSHRSAAAGSDPVVSKVYIGDARDYRERSAQLFGVNGDFRQIVDQLHYRYSVEFTGPPKFEDLICFVATNSWGLSSSMPILGPVSNAFSEFGLSGSSLQEPLSGSTFGTLDEPKALCSTIYAAGFDGYTYTDAVGFDIIVVNGVDVKDIYEGDVLLLAGQLERVYDGTAVVSLNSVRIVGPEAVYPIGKFEGVFR